MKEPSFGHKRKLIVNVIQSIMITKFKRKNDDSWEEVNGENGAVSSPGCRTPGKKKRGSPRVKGSPMRARIVGGRRIGTPVRRTGAWNTARRLAVIQKYKDMMAVRSDRRVKHFGKREKTILLNVRKFNEDEARTVKIKTKGNSDLRKVLDGLLKVPLEQVTKRTAEMTGCPRRTIQRFKMQEDKLELTPKQKKGKIEFVCPDWILTDIRIIITG